VNLELACCCSNRSAALLKLNKVAKALADAEECVKLDPAFHKGYMRMALALESQQRLEEVRSLLCKDLPVGCSS
jgi:tetratricopeptide (TPR) repeat protein